MNPSAVVAAVRGLGTPGRAWLLLPVAVVMTYLVWTWQTGGLAAESPGRGAATAARTVTGSTGLPAATASSGLSVTAPDVTGLFPGLARAMKVVVLLGSSPVVLERLVGEVVAGAGGVPEGCPLDIVVVTGWSAPVGASPSAPRPLAPREFRGLPVVVAMPETGTDQDACKLADFALLLTATGTELEPTTLGRTTRNRTTR